MKIIQIDLEVSIHGYPADIFINFKVPNDYEDWSSGMQQHYLEKHKDKIIKKAYEDIIITLMFNGVSL